MTWRWGPNPAPLLLGTPALLGAGGKAPPCWLLGPWPLMPGLEPLGSQAGHLGPSPYQLGTALAGLFSTGMAARDTEAHPPPSVLDVGTRPLGAVAVRGQGGGESGRPFTEARAGCALLSLTPGQTPLFFQPISSLVGRQRAEQLPGVPEDQ